MKQRIAMGRFLSLLGIAGAVGVTGCQVPRSDDINRVQPGYVRKAIFQDGSEWHYRRTVVESEAVQSVVGEGSGDIFIERVVFEVQEDLLLARKAYNGIPGAGLDLILEDNEDYKGTVLAAWPITSHFDIIRGYSTLTGRETNEIVENTVDRPWYERDYMRVDWATNLVDSSLFGSYAFGSPVFLDWISTGSYWKNIETNPTDPFVSRFSDDYVEVTDNVMIGMDVWTCWAFSGYSLWGLRGCGFGEAKMRHSFKRVTEPSDFVPRYYPDSVVVQDDNGNPIEDPNTGEVVREPIYNRFGIFRFSTPTYDRGYGFTESGRSWRAMIFNIWENSRDENGEPLPYAMREEKPIIYYLNTEYPPRYREAARQVAAEYNRVYKGMVASLKGVPEDDVKEMFEIRDNDCNEANIIGTVLENPNLLYAVERAVCTEGEVCNIDSTDMAAMETALQDQIGIGNLKRVCTSLEEATLNPETGVSDFEWQRVGDLRYNMVVWLDNPQLTGWGGYGPMHADALTGETISATAFLKATTYERAAATIADYICYINDEPGCDATNVAYGLDIRRLTAETQRRALAMADVRPSQSSMETLRRRLDALKAGPDGGLSKDPTGNSLANRLKRAEGTEIEKAIMTPELISVLSNGAYVPDRDGPVTEEMREVFNLSYLVEGANPFSPQRMEMRNMLSSSGYCFLEADFDPNWAGLALDLKDMSREERFEIIANRTIRHVMLHEIGHNVGLAHNFEGSYDALNFDTRFWENVDGTREQQIQANLDEFKHTTVMEYMSSKGMFSDFLGTYDEAAIRFVYGNQVAVFDSQQVDPNLQGGQALRDWRYYNDYHDLPDHLCGGSCASDEAKVEVVSNRRWVDFDPQNPPQNEVPFLFCDNFYDRRTPFCATFDYGASMTEIQANYYSMWKDYFLFNNFARDRLVPLGWNPNAAAVPSFLVLDFMDNVSQHFQVWGMTDPEFQGTALEADMAGALFNSMNVVTELMATPEPDRYCHDGADFGPSGEPIYLPWGGTAGCDPYRPVEELVDEGLNAIDIPMGVGRPRFIGLTWNVDYEERQLEYIGSYFEKFITAFLLGSTRPRLLRTNYDLDLRNVFLSPYRLFEPEMREFYGNLFELDGIFIYFGIIDEMGDFWCRDPSAPDRPDLGYVEPRRMFDVAGDEGSFPRASSSCLEPALLNPGFTANLPYQALFAAHAILSSDWDTRLDLGKLMKIWVVGAYDDIDYLNTFDSCETAAPNTDCYCSYTDIQTGLEYRALNRAFEGRTSMPCELIEQAQRGAETYENSPSNVNQDRWRLYVERLEDARILYRVFQDR